MGGAPALLARARDDFERGEYRWVAQVVNHVVFGDPSNQPARQLQADALEQLGYQSESGPWRSFYLTGAQELRNGTPSIPGLRGAATVDVMRAMTPTMILDNCAVKLNGPNVADQTMEFDIHFVDHDEIRSVHVQRGVLNHRRSRRSEDTPAGITTVRANVETIVRITSDLVSINEAIERGDLTIDGSHDTFERFLTALDQFEMFFAIIEP